jgi:hypothetical protein
MAAHLFLRSRIDSAAPEFHLAYRTPQRRDLDLRFEYGVAIVEQALADWLVTTQRTVTKSFSEHWLATHDRNGIALF